MGSWSSSTSLTSTGRLRLELVVLLSAILLGSILAGVAFRAGLLGPRPKSGAPGLRVPVLLLVEYTYPAVLVLLMVYAIKKAARAGTGSQASRFYPPLQP